MARKPIRSEDFNPSYDEVIGELSSTISKLIVENSILKITIRKLEEFVNQIDQKSISSKDEDIKEF
jgi:regulator of replication initiation timing